MTSADVIDVTDGKTAEELASLRQLTLIIYILSAAGWATGGFTSIVAIIINYVKRDDTEGTLYRSHFSWQIRTFWWSLGWSVLAFITLIVGVGFIVFIAVGIWSIYRIVRGLLNWNDRKPMPV